MSEKLVEILIGIIVAQTGAIVVGIFKFAMWCAKVETRVEKSEKDINLLFTKHREKEVENE